MRTNYFKMLTDEQRSIFNHYSNRIIWCFTDKYLSDALKVYHAMCWCRMATEFYNNTMIGELLELEIANLIKTYDMFYKK